MNDVKGICVENVSDRHLPDLKWNASHRQMRLRLPPRIRVISVDASDHLKSPNMVKTY